MFYQERFPLLFEHNIQGVLDIGLTWEKKSSTVRLAATHEDPEMKLGFQQFCLISIAVQDKDKWWLWNSWDSIWSYKDLARIFSNLLLNLLILWPGVRNFPYIELVLEYIINLVWLSQALGFESTKLMHEYCALQWMSPIFLWIIISMKRAQLASM